MCEEYPGPKAAYEQSGIEQLWCQRSISITRAKIQLNAVVDFIQRHAAKNGTVYVHCKSGDEQEVRRSSYGG